MRLFQVDAFTAEPFKGNPAAVCLLGRDQDPGDAWMQAVAAEMNLSETAFVQPGDAGGGFRLRWFTPAVEVELCGHATLASAHVLWSEGVVGAADPIRFATLSGELTASPGDGGAIRLDFPATPPAPVQPPPWLGEALGAAPLWVGASIFDWLVELGSEAAVRALEPDLARLRTLPVRAVEVTAAAEEGSEFDFVARVFGPAVGIDEDPVTGSAYCCLGPFWAERLGKAELLAYQASRRGGVVGVRVEPGGDRVSLTGQAVTVFAGELR